MQVMRQLNRSQAFRSRKSDYERNEIVTACISVVNADYLLHTYAYAYAGKQS